MIFSEPLPFKEAIDRIQSKTAVASKLSTAEWAQMQLSLKDRAFFSAGVDSIRTVAQLQRGIEKALTTPADETFMSKDKFVATMRQALGAAPGDSGDLQDITSSKRLGLIYDFQVEDAQEYGRWKAGQDPDLLDEFPCQELLRVESRDEPRDWSARWADAGGQFFGGRMIARKDDPIWTNISRFGRPWPPFDFGSGMGVEDIDRGEAVDLEVVSESTIVPPQEKDFNEGLEASVPDASPAVLDGFKEIFGDQVDVTREGKITWQGAKIQKLFEQAIEPGSKADWGISLGRAQSSVASSPKLKDAELFITASDLRHINRRHVVDEKDPSQRPLTLLDLQMIPHVWRAANSVKPGKLPDTFEFEADFIGQQTVVVFDRKSTKGNRWGVSTVWTKKGGTP